MKTPRFCLFLSFFLLFSLGVSCTTSPGTNDQCIKTPALASTTVQTSAKPDKTTSTTPARTSTALTTSLTITDTIQVNMILGRPTDTSIAINLYAQDDIQAVIIYGVADGGLDANTNPINLKALVPQTIELTGLLPDTRYFYTVLVNGQNSVQHMFHTQRAPGSAFTFTIDSDPHNQDPNFNGELYAITLSNALADEPDFHINLGDTFMTEKIKPQTYTEAEGTFSDMRPYFGIIGADAPLFLVNGNHEGELGWLNFGKSQSIPIWSNQLRQLYYPNPLPNGFYSGSSTIDPVLGSPRDSYYAWTWGDALFIVLDPFWYTTTKPQNSDLNTNWNWTLGREQYEWLKTTLENSQAKFKFVFIHHLVGGSQEARGGIEIAHFFEWGGDNLDGSYGFDEHRPGWGKPIHQLLVDNHVSVVFHGHDHLYVKQELDGIIYQEVPQPSMIIENPASQAAEYGYTHGTIMGSSGHLRVIVTNDQVTIEYVRSHLPGDEKPSQQNRRVDDRYTFTGF